MGKFFRIFRISSSRTSLNPKTSEKVSSFKISCSLEEESFVYNVHIERHGQISYKQLISTLSSLFGRIVALLKMLSRFF